MRTRLAIVLALTALVLSAAPLVPAHAQDEALVAQVSTDEGEGEAGADPGADTGSAGEEEGEGGEDAEAGAGEGEQEAAEEEIGPPWTYQMAWISIAMLVLLFFSMFMMYRKLVLSRQRDAV